MPFLISVSNFVQIPSIWVHNGLWYCAYCDCSTYRLSRTFKVLIDITHNWNKSIPRKRKFLETFELAIVGSPPKDIGRWFSIESINRTQELESISNPDANIPHLFSLSRSLSRIDYNWFNINQMSHTDWWFIVWMVCLLIANGHFGFCAKNHPLCFWRLFLFIFFFFCPFICFSFLSSISFFNLTLVSTWIRWHIYDPIKIWFFWIDCCWAVWIFVAMVELGSGIEWRDRNRWLRMTCYIIKPNIGRSRKEITAICSAISKIILKIINHYPMNRMDNLWV